MFDDATHLHESKIPIVSYYGVAICKVILNSYPPYEAGVLCLTAFHSPHTLLAFFFKSCTSQEASSVCTSCTKTYFLYFIFLIY